jgi:hypothetical protein
MEHPAKLVPISLAPGPTLRAAGADHRASERLSFVLSGGEVKIDDSYPLPAQAVGGAEYYLWKT